MTGATLQAWVDVVTAGLLVASGIASLVAAAGLARLKSFLARMHPPALASTFGVWSVTLASIAWFSAHESVPVVHAVVIPFLVAITAPVTTMLLARAALARKRDQRADVPPPLASSGSEGGSAGAAPPGP